MTRIRGLDEFLPRCDASERHSAVLGHAVDAVWSALFRVDLARPLGVRLLLGLRAIPDLLLRPARLLQLPRGLTVGELERLGFGVLSREENRELVLGVEGRFWRPVGNIEPFEISRYRSPVRPGLARAVWSFELESDGVGGCRLVTETRIACGDAGSRRWFRAYWLLVRPGSGLIRRWLLSEVGRECARAGRQTRPA